MVGRLVASAVVSVGVLGACAGAASAATVTPTGSYAAAAGETNNLVVTRVGADYVFTDAVGVTITPTAPCAPGPTVNVATCPAGPIPGLFVSLNDMADQARMDASLVAPLGFISVIGGDGADTLRGADNVTTQLSGEGDGDTLTSGTGGNGQNYSLAGGAGDDTLTGGPSSDQANGGPGTDTISTAGGTDSYSPTAGDGADSLSLGADRDRVDLRSLTGNLGISLNGVADDGVDCPGASCEGDNFAADIEDIELGRGNDSIVGSARSEAFDGGQGNDVVDGGDGNDFIEGGAGDDVVLGGGGNDELGDFLGTDSFDGGDGDDVLFPAFRDTGVDSYGGGGGIDTLGDATEDVVPLRITLDGLADDGVVETGAVADNVMPDVENATGSEGDDLLVGNASANVLQGESGNDTIAGGGGNDQLNGERGNDNLDGGADPDSLDGAAGIDVLRSRDGGADQLDCGSSVDSVIGDSFDLAPASCESVAAGVAIVSAKLKGSKVKLTVSCPAAEGAACPVEAKLAFKGSKIAAGSGTVAAGQSEAIKLKLSKDGKDLVDDKPKFKADATVTYTDPTGAVLVTKQKVAVS